MTKETALARRMREQKEAGSPIYAAVEPLLVAAIADAETAARTRVAKIEAELIAAGWDRKIVAPRANPGMGRAQYLKANGKYSFVYGITNPVDPNEHVKGLKVSICDIDAKGVQRYVDECKEFAAADYEAFVYKLVKKVGKCTSATLTGENVWHSSVLSVMKQEGNEVFGQRWKTTTIINTSVHGKRFYQWPTRLMK